MEKKRGKRSKPMDDGVWDCSVCTFKNSAEAFKCAMCDVRKGTSTRKPKPNPQLVAQQVAQQMVTVSKKHATKRAAERVDLGSDTSQDSHRSETREGELTYMKASSSVQMAVHPPIQQSSSVLAPSTSRCETSKPSDDQPKVNTSRPGHETNHATFARHPQPGESHNKSFSSVRQNVHPASSNGFTYPSYMDITVNGLTVRIEERDPKNVNSRQASAQKMKRRKTGSNLGLSTVSANPSPVANNSHRMSLASDASGLDASNISESNAERTLDRSGTETSSATQQTDQQPAVSSGEVATPSSTCSTTPVTSTATPPQPSTPPASQLQPQKTTEALHGEPPN